MLHDKLGKRPRSWSRVQSTCLPRWQGHASWLLCDGRVMVCSARQQWHNRTSRPLYASLALTISSGTTATTTSNGIRSSMRRTSVPRSLSSTMISITALCSLKVCRLSMCCKVWAFRHGSCTSRTRAIGLPTGITACCGISPSLTGSDSGLGWMTH
jgi:hypothetical protein